MDEEKAGPARAGVLFNFNSTGGSKFARLTILDCLFRTIRFLFRKCQLVCPHGHGGVPVGILGTCSSAIEGLKNKKTANKRIERSTA